MRFEFATATRIIFGVGVLREIGPLARTAGRHAFVVTGATPDRSAPLRQLLGECEVAATTFAIAGEPTVAQVTEGARQARAGGCDLVIGFGGGSALDASKAIAALATNEGGAMDYVEVIGQGRVLQRPPLPCFAIPTTAGTGAEVTRNAVLTSPEHQLKASLRSPLLLPRFALVDPELTCGLPPSATAATGLDALTQLIEAFVSCRANPFTDGLCREGLACAARSLELAWSDGVNLAAREDMSLAALLSGLALANAGLGAVHGFAAPIGGRFSAPHGAVCAILLPPVMRTNLAALQARAPRHPALARYAEVAALLTRQPDAPAEAGIAWVAGLVDRFALPSLRSYGVTGGHFPELAARAQESSSMKGNPLPLTAGELAGILEAAL